MLLKINETIEKNMLIILMIFIIIAFIKPNYFNWIPQYYIDFLLMGIMFIVGLKINYGDFLPLIKYPKYICLGVIGHFIIMPLMALLISMLLNLNDALTIGLILLGACPSGTTSNVITYLCKGDTALSVGITICTTIMSIIITPILTLLLINSNINYYVADIGMSIILCVIIPLILGMLINHNFKKSSEKISVIAPSASIILISLMLSIIISVNSNDIASNWIIATVAVILLSFSGHIITYIIGKILKLPKDKFYTLFIDLGMKNSGLAASLAAESFPMFYMATIPGAIYSIWQNIWGIILLRIIRELKKKNILSE